MGIPRERYEPAEERARVQEALACIPADDRDLWVRIGMTVKSALGEEGFELSDEWSQRSASYRASDVVRLTAAVGDNRY